MARKKPAVSDAPPPETSHAPGTGPSRSMVNGRVPIVGIGASAGGVKALEEFFLAIPPEPGMAFIVVQHLDPTRVSEMASLLSRRTRLKVAPAENGTKVRPNEVYTIPPDRYLTVENGVFQLTIPPEPRGFRHPIDALFYSLAQSAAECAVGVVLSGSGSDGSLGLRAIKGQGGLAVVQDPRSAEYDSMPRGAIATGLADFILPPGKMMDAIVSFINHDYVQRPIPAEPSRNPDHVTGILQLLYARRNVDFSGYKKGTLLRRINRRMSLRNLRSGSEYIRLLREDPQEVNTLFNDLLIQVTRFFREPDAWKQLESEVLTRLVEDVAPGAPIRVWVPGCATGEEAYSVAMLLLELKEKSGRNFSIQIFASDLDKISLDRARAGVYPDSIAADVSPARLEKFFVPSEHRFIVGQLLRDTLVFAHQNLLADPPFSRLDLITCRNVLIYLESEMQARVCELFHFALKPGRFLFLGNSETVGPQTDLFQPISKRSRIFRRLGTVRPDRLRLSLAGLQAGAIQLPSVAMPISRENVALNHVRDMVLERYASACALVNRKCEIVALYGPTSKYLTQPSGSLTPDLISWVKEGVRTKLRVALQNAVRRNGPVTVRGLRIRRGSMVVSATCTVEPLSGPLEIDGLLLVVFEDEATEVVRPRGKNADKMGVEPLVTQLEYELKVTRDELQASVEQLESSNEELRASNEEILSMNEELESANEELENSKEELQSLNEELTTVNSQLEAKLIELQILNDDVTNLLTSTDLPAIFLDRSLRIRRFTPSMARLFRLINADTGRSVEDIVTLIDDPALLPDARAVLATLRPMERDVPLGDGGGLLRRVLPYRTEDSRIEGVVITYTDLSDRIQADRKVREALEFSDRVIETLREPLLVLDERLVIRSANSAFYKVFQKVPGEIIGRSIYEIGNGEWNIPEIGRMLRDGEVRDSSTSNLELRRSFSGVGERIVCLTGRSFTLRGERILLLGMEDLTAQRQAEQARNEALRQLVSYDEKERHRLALELHDETGQHVTAFLLGLATLRGSYADQPQSRELIDNLRGLAENLARNLHGISLQLRPISLDDHGLERALLNFTEELGVHPHLEVDFQASGLDGRLPRHIETVLYRVTQEALTNVVRHARASKVGIVLSRQNKEISLIVEDNGRGFDPEQVLGETTKAHLGLRGMRERVMLAGGTLTIESEPGAGTTLFARIPLRNKSNGNSEE